MTSTFPAFLLAQEEALVAPFQSRSISRNNLRNLVEQRCALVRRAPVGQGSPLYRYEASQELFPITPEEHKQLRLECKELASQLRTSSQNLRQQAQLFSFERCSPMTRQADRQPILLTTLAQNMRENLEGMKMGKVREQDPTALLALQEMGVCARKERFLYEGVQNRNEQVEMKLGAGPIWYDFAVWEETIIVSKLSYGDVKETKQEREQRLYGETLQQKADRVAREMRESPQETAVREYAEDIMRLRGLSNRATENLLSHVTQVPGYADAILSKKPPEYKTRAGFFKAPANWLMAPFVTRSGAPMCTSGPEWFGSIRMMKSRAVERLLLPEPTASIGIVLADRVWTSETERSMHSFQDFAYRNVQANLLPALLGVLRSNSIPLIVGGTPTPGLRVSIETRRNSNTSIEFKFANPHLVDQMQVGPIYYFLLGLDRDVDRYQPLPGASVGRSWEFAYDQNEMLRRALDKSQLWGNYGIMGQFAGWAKFPEQDRVMGSVPSRADALSPAEMTQLRARIDAVMKLKQFVQANPDFTFDTGPVGLSPLFGPGVGRNCYGTTTILCFQDGKIVMHLEALQRPELLAEVVQGLFGSGPVAVTSAGNKQIWTFPDVTLPSAQVLLRIKNLERVIRVLKDVDLEDITIGGHFQCTITLPQVVRDLPVLQELNRLLEMAEGKHKREDFALDALVLLEKLRFDQGSKLTEFDVQTSPSGLVFSALSPECMKLIGNKGYIKMEAWAKFVRMAHYYLPPVAPSDQLGDIDEILRAGIRQSGLLQQGRINAAALMPGISEYLFNVVPNVLLWQYPLSIYRRDGLTLRFMCPGRVSARVTEMISVMQAASSEQVSLYRPTRRQPKRKAE